MYYLTNVYGSCYEITDSKTNTKSKLSRSGIEDLLRRGVHIKGVAYIKGELTFVPVPPLCLASKKDLVKAKLLRGSIEVLDGFDLETIGDKVIAKPITEKFCTYVERNIKYSGLILSLPDMITDISSYFLNKCFSYVYDPVLRLYIDLPASLRYIGKSSFNESYLYCRVIIDGIRFNGVVDEIEGGINNSSCTFCLYCNVNSPVNFRVRKLNSYSLLLRFDKLEGIQFRDVNVYLKDIVELSYQSIIRDINKIGITFHLGESLETIGHFLEPFYYRKTDDFMSSSNIIHLSDNCRLREIDLSYERGYYDLPSDRSESNTFYSYYNYVVVLSESMYNELVRRYDSGELVIKGKEIKGWIGVLTYSNRDEFKDLRENLRYYLKNSKKYFSDCFSLDNYNQIVRLNLRK